LLANLANALLASAILYTSNFFLNAFHVSLAASINSVAKALEKFIHFLSLAEFIIHLAAKNNCLFCFTS
jgi:hypothetical protein